MGADRFADPFYASWQWRKCRLAYMKSKGGLCERCLARGIINAGSRSRPLEVHHRIRLTPENIADPRVALNWENLELLCKDCHEAEHAGPERERRWRIGADGRVEIREERPGRPPLVR